MSVTSIPHTSAASNWYCTRCEMAFLDTSNEKPCPRCHKDDALIEREEPKKDAKPVKASTHKPSAMFRRASIERSRTGIERVAAWGVLLISFVGTAAAFHGGWGAMLAAPRTAAIVAGLLIQSGLTYVQWAYYRRRSLAWGSRLIDTILTSIGYGGLVLASLTRFWEARGVDSVIAGQPGAVLAAWCVIGLVSFGLAWYPESRLVD